MREGFDAFRLRVLSDPVLQRELRQLSDQAALFERVLALGRELGYEFTMQDVQAEVLLNQRGWIERFVWQ